MSVMVMVDVDRVVEGMALVHRVLLHNLSRMMILHLKAMLGEKFIGEIYHCSPRCLRGWEWPISMERGGRVVFSIPACVFFVSSHAMNLMFSFVV